MEEVQILDGIDNPIRPGYTLVDNEYGRSVIRGTLPHGRTYDEEVGPQPNEEQIRERNQEVADADQLVIYDDDSSVQSVSSIPSSDDDGHYGCGSGNFANCLDRLEVLPGPGVGLRFYPYSDEELPGEEDDPGQEENPVNMLDFMNVVQALYPE